MKILYITNNSSTNGGANKSLQDMCKEIQARGHEVLVVSPAGEEFAKRLEQNQIPQHIMPDISRGVACFMGGVKENLRNVIKKITLPLYIRGRVGKLCKLIQEEKVDLVHTNTSVSFEGVLAARKMGIPHVWHIREFMEEDYGMRYTMSHSYMKKLYHRSDVVVCISEAIKEKFLPLLDENKTTVIYNAVSEPLYQQNQETIFDNGQKKVFTIIGAIQHSKGIHDAIEAFARIAEGIPDTVLWIVGNYCEEDAYFAQLQSLIQNYHLADRVKLWGGQKAVGNIIRNTYCGLMCSYKEGLGRVTIEHQLLGKPVIGAAAGGTRELIQDGVNGLLYRPGDVTQLADKMLWMYQNEEAAKQMGWQGQRIMKEKCDSATYAQKILDVYERARKNCKKNP